MDSVSAEVNGPLTASVAVDNLYVGGGFGGGTLPDLITVTFGENAALNAENTSSSGGINIGGLIGYNSVGSLDLRGSKLVNKADSALTISAKAIASIHAGGAGRFSTDATAASDKWLYADETTVMEGEFAVKANSSSGVVYEGGIAGRTSVSYSVSIKNYTNKTELNGTIIAAGWRIQNSGGNKRLFWKLLTSPS